MSRKLQRTEVCADCSAPGKWISVEIGHSGTKRRRGGFASKEGRSCCHCQWVRRVGKQLGLAKVAWAQHKHWEFREIGPAKSLLLTVKPLAWRFQSDKQLDTLRVEVLAIEAQIYSLPTEEPFVLILLTAIEFTSTLSQLIVMYCLVYILFRRCQNTWTRISSFVM